MDSVTLRQSHFKLGGDLNKYITSSMEQSEGIEKTGRQIRAHLPAGRQDLKTTKKYR